MARQKDKNNTSLEAQCNLDKANNVDGSAHPVDQQYHQFQKGKHSQQPEASHRDPVAN